MKSFLTCVLAAIAAGFITCQSSPAAAKPASTTQQKTPNEAPNAAGGQAYADHCAICHGDKLEGILPGFPPLAGVGRHMNDEQITKIVHEGKGRMPAFAKLNGAELKELLRYLDESQTLPPTAVHVGSDSGQAELSPEAQVGSALFQQHCAFCHGRDTAGGETGPGPDALQACCERCGREQD